MINRSSKTIVYLRHLLSGFWVLMIILFAADGHAQPIPVGDVWEDQFRTLQLLSGPSNSISFTNRPVWKHTYQEVFDTSKIPLNSLWAQPLNSTSAKLPGSFSAGTYDAILTSTINSDLPYGGNNGAAWYGRGITTEIKAGGWLTSDYLTLTFRPHLSYQQNSDFTAPRFIPVDNEDNPRYRAIFSNIDMPYRFGPDAYTTFDLGHSSARIHYKAIEAGISTESLWWGPGIQNALVMSNNAPGLRHVFFGTRSPLKLPLNIANIEFRLIGAWPEDSDYFDLGQQYQRDRFMSGANIIFSPSFLGGLHLGFTRAVHMYVPEDGLDLKNLLSAISFSDRQTSGSDGQNQLISVYFRWVFPESGAEVYAEYFREDSYFDGRDLFIEPDHDRAYTIGAQKVIESDWIDFFKINLEINNLVPNRVDEVRPEVAYYSHSQIKQGHTNGGQVLGAAIGPGSGSQYLGFEGYFQKGMAGLFVQRIEDNDFFYFEFYDNPTLSTAYKDIWRNRIDFNIGLKGYYRDGPVLLSGKLVWNNNLNYGRFDYGDLDINFDTFDPHDVVNIQLQLSARYLF